MNESSILSMMNSLPSSLRDLDLSLLLQRAEKRLTKRKLEASLLGFTSHFFRELRGDVFIENWHHREIEEALRKVERGEILNLLINCPPRYTKTELVVINWMAQSIARNPKAKFIHLSYADDLALDNSAKTKEIVLSEPYQEMWPVRLKQDSKSKQKWYTEQGGGVYATAAGGAVTGFGAGATADEDDGKFYGAIIIDDPLKPDDARSEAMRKAVNDRLNNTIKSRRNSRRTPIVIIMQRLHEDDMSGFVLAGKMGEPFHHLKLKALDDGRALWELKHTVEELELMRTHDRMTFATQYQQEPVPAEGAVYKLDWFARYHNLPQPPNRTMVVHSWDTAFKKGEHNDPSVCTVWHVTPSLYYLAEVHHGRWDYPELRKRVFDLGNDQKPEAILIEDKASGQSLIQELKTGSTLPVIAIEPENDKETRARTTAAMVEAAKVSLPIEATWLADYEAEMITFPNGKHDDRVDSTSQFLRWMRDRGGDSDTEFQAMMDRLYGR